MNSYVTIPDFDLQQLVHDDLLQRTLANHYFLLASECEECHHSLALHADRYGCEFERADISTGEATYAPGPCGCMQHRELYYVKQIFDARTALLKAENDLERASQEEWCVTLQFSAVQKAQERLKQLERAAAVEREARTGELEIT